MACFSLCVSDDQGRKALRNARRSEADQDDELSGTRRREWTVASLSPEPRHSPRSPRYRHGHKLFESSKPPSLRHHRSPGIKNQRSPRTRNEAPCSCGLFEDDCGFFNDSPRSQSPRYRPISQADDTKYELLVPLNDHAIRYAEPPHFDDTLPKSHIANGYLASENSTQLASSSSSGLKQETPRTMGPRPEHQGTPRARGIAHREQQQPNSAEVPVPAFRSRSQEPRNR